MHSINLKDSRESRGAVLSRTSPGCENPGARNSAYASGDPSVVLGLVVSEVAVAM